MQILERIMRFEWLLVQWRRHCRQNNGGHLLLETLINSILYATRGPITYIGFLRNYKRILYITRKTNFFPVVYGSLMLKTQKLHPSVDN